MSPLTSDPVAETSGTPPVEVKSPEPKTEHKSIDEILDKFAEGDVEEKTNLLADEKKDEQTSVEEDEASIEGKADKDEEQGDDKAEEDFEIATPVRLKTVEKKYPNILKEFPWLKIAYQRDHQFVEIFPTVEDAKEASAKAESFSRFENDLLEGKVDSVFKSLKQADPDSFGNLVDNLLPTLASVDKDAYFHIMGNTAKSFISSMVKEARDSGNEELGQAAVLFHQFMFGKSEFVPPKPFGKPKDETKATNTREEALLNERFNDVSSDLDRTTTNAIKSTIAVSIDPQGVMSDYVKRQAVREAHEYVEEAIRSDRSTAAKLNKLWQDARSKNFNKSSLEDIKRTYLAVAKMHLREGIKKARTEALKGIGKLRTAEDNDDQQVKRLPVGRPAGSTRSNIEQKARTMTTRQFLDQD